MILFRLLTKKWIISTILVLIGIAGMIRLGVWQLDRLEQRRIFNARVSDQMTKPPFELSNESINMDLTGMEYRSVIVRGEFDFSNQVGLRNQAWNDRYGIHLITPLHINGSDRVVMVDRGWIPAEDIEPENWFKYDQPGEVEVFGRIRESQKKADFGRISDPIQSPGEKLTLWNLINIEQMQAKLPFDLISIYITQAPNDKFARPPYGSELNLDLSEGPHFGYAIQWFTFATILAIVYLIYIYRAEKKVNSLSDRSDPKSHVEKPILGNQKPH
jgi:surfeit locus 1 family protein